MFAKLYGTDDDQVLVMLETDEDGDPCVRFSSNPKGWGVCSFTMSFTDTDEGHDKAEETFKAMDEKRAREIVANSILDMLPKSNPEPDICFCHTQAPCPDSPPAQAD